MDISLEGSSYHTDHSRRSQGSYTSTGYRPTYSTSARTHSSYGRGSGLDEAFDSSIHFQDEIEFGDGVDVPIETGHSYRPQVATHNKSLVDIFLADDSVNSDGFNEFRPVPMKQTERGLKIKKWICYLGMAIVFIVIFVTVPKPSWGGGSSSEKETSTVVNGTVEVTAPPEEIPNPEDAFMSEGFHVDMNRPEAIHALILEQKVSTQEELNTEYSPAALALTWISASDKANLDVPHYPHNQHNVGTPQEQGYKLLQRYALACLYFGIEESYSRNRNLQQFSKQATQNEKERRQQFNKHWTVEPDSCDWFGVTCNGDGYVTALDLKSTLLSGTLRPEIFQQAAFPYLTSLDLSHNTISHVPTEFLINNQLQALQLEQNHIEGSASLGPILEKLQGLTELNMIKNRLSGHLPEDWSGLMNLETLKLANNGLSGPLSPGMNALTNLQWFQLDSNQITGSIPDDYATMKQLHTLKLAHNHLEGTLPNFLGRLPLDHLSLQDNKLSGYVPASLGQLSILEDLHLQKTELVGTMPQEVCDLVGQKLKTLTADCKTELDCSCCTKCY